MQLKVNGENVDITLEDEKTIGDFLSSFEKEAAKNEATTIRITLNGKQIPAEQFEDILSEPLTENTDLDLTVLSKATLIDSLVQCADRFEAINARLPEVSVLLQSAKDAEANSIITSLAEEIQEFCHLAAMSTLFPDVYEGISIEGQDIRAFFAEFTDILKDFENAMQAKDSVTVGDLSEYEIAPRLEKIAQAVKNLST